MQEFEQVTAAQRLMSDAEAQEVLRLHLTKTGGAPLISTADVAEAVRIPEQQVEALLAEVRSQRQLAAQTLPAHRQKVRDVLMALIAGLTLMAIVVFGAANTRVRSNDGGWAVKPATYVLASGSIERPLKTHVAPVDADQQDLLNVLFADSEANLVPHGSGPLVVSASETLRGLKAKNWDTPGIRHVIFTLSTGPETLESSLPYYMGTDPTIQKLCADERYSRIQSLLRQIADRARLTSQ